MSKAEYAQRHGLTVRRCTKADRRAARTDYQRGAQYIIMGPMGKMWYSGRGTMADMRAVVMVEEARP